MEFLREMSARKWKTSFIGTVVGTEGAAFARQNVIPACQYVPQISRLPELGNVIGLLPIHESPDAEGLGRDALRLLRLLSR